MQKAIFLYENSKFVALTSVTYRGGDRAKLATMKPNTHKIHKMVLIT